MAASTERAKSLAAKWAALADSGVVEKVNQQRRAFWDALDGLTRSRGAKIVSPPYLSPLRIEIDPQKTQMLCVTLKHYGYLPSCTEQVSVFDGSGFTKHDIIMVDLPSLQYLARIAER